jgi:hypothetical protein
MKILNSVKGVINKNEITITRENNRLLKVNTSINMLTLNSSKKYFVKVKCFKRNQYTNNYASSTINQINFNDKNNRAISSYIDIQRYITSNESNISVSVSVLDENKFVIDSKTNISVNIQSIASTNSDLVSQYNLYRNMLKDVCKSITLFDDVYKDIITEPYWLTCNSKKYNQRELSRILSFLNVYDFKLSISYNKNSPSVSNKKILISLKSVIQMLISDKNSVSYFTSADMSDEIFSFFYDDFDVLKENQIICDYTLNYNNRNYDKASSSLNYRVDSLSYINFFAKKELDNLASERTKSNNRLFYKESLSKNYNTNKINKFFRDNLTITFNKNIDKEDQKSISSNDSLYNLHIDLKGLDDSFLYKLYEYTTFDDFINSILLKCKITFSDVESKVLHDIEGSFFISEVLKINQTTKEYKVDNIQNALRINKVLLWDDVRANENLIINIRTEAFCFNKNAKDSFGSTASNLVKQHVINTSFENRRKISINTIDKKLGILFNENSSRSDIKKILLSRNFLEYYFDNNRRYTESIG